MFQGFYENHNNNNLMKNNIKFSYSSNLNSKYKKSIFFDILSISFEL